MTFYNTKIKEWGSSQRPIVLRRVEDEQVALIREDLIALTKNLCSSVVLNQLLYWTLRVKDFDLLMAEEKRTSLRDRPSFYHGWFSKSVQEFLEETLLTISVSTLRRYLSFLVERGWVQTRRHSQNKQRQRTQYRVNLRKLCIDLQEHGYSLPDFAIYEILFPSKQKQSQLQRERSIS
jgi:hypothetical protein